MLYRRLLCCTEKISPEAGNGNQPPAAVFVFAPDRKAERPALHLGHFRGVLHVDGYAGFESLVSKGDVVLAACWSHTRWQQRRR